MRVLSYFVVPLLLAGCSGGANENAAGEPSNTANATAAPEPATAAVTVANGSPPGTYTVTTADGTVRRTTVNADGSYTDLNADGTVAAEGTWSVRDGKTCFAPTTAGVQAMCFTETPPAADGSFTATPDQGDPVTVRPAPAS